jgi:hypothetical protein
MYWLITINRELSTAQVDALLEKWGAERTETPPIPLGDNETVIEVSGSKDLPQKLSTQKGVIKVSPSSAFTLY